MEWFVQFQVILKALKWAREEGNLLHIQKYLTYKAHLRAANITHRGRANSPWVRLHEISTFFGMEIGLNYTL